MPFAKISRINPEYNPDWEKILRDRTQLRDALLADLEYVESTTCLSSHIERVSLQLEQAQEEIIKAYHMQHRTVGEYAAWLFSNFPVGTIPDIEGFVSMKEVDEGWSAASIREFHPPSRAADAAWTPHPK